MTRWPKFNDMPDTFLELCNSSGLMQKFISAARMARYTEDTNWRAFLLAWKANSEERQVSESTNREYEHLYGTGRKTYRVFRRVVGVISGRGEVRDFAPIQSVRGHLVHQPDVLCTAVGDAPTDRVVFAVSLLIHAQRRKYRAARVPDVPIRS